MLQFLDEPPRADRLPLSEWTVEPSTAAGPPRRSTALDNALAAISAFILESIE